MKSLESGLLRRVNLDADSDSDSASEHESDQVDLEDLSEADLSDSEVEEGSEEEAALEDELADVPFATLMKAQSGMNSTRTKPAPTSNDRPEHKMERTTQEKEDRAVRQLKRKREHKHAPMEMSSKKPVGRSREVVETFKIERRDPRFDPDTLKAPGDASHIKHKYKFLEDYKKDEMKILKDSISKEKDVTAKEKLEKALSSMQSRQQAAKERERRQRVLTEFKHKERDAAKDGKIPYHLKASEKNKLYLKDKFDSMKDSKGLDKFLEKKRKRRSQKDRKRALPL